MAVGNYSYTNLLDQVIDPARRTNITNVITARNIINRAARRVVTDVDLRSTKRNAPLGNNLFDDVYSYPAPSDLKAVIDFDPQVNRSSSFRLELVSEPEFNMKKTVRSNIIALATDDLVNRILFSGDVDDTVVVGATLDSLTEDGGTWTAYGDATNVAVDNNNYVKGSGSISFDLGGSGTTAGIYNTGLDEFDISDYTDNGSVFVWVYINSTTNLTNFVLEVGNDLTTNYYQITVTKTNEASSFVAGWNLLRFDFSDATENGTVTDDEITAMRIYMTKTAEKSDGGYRFDHISFHTGEIHNIIYYSKYAWQSAAGTFLENSTDDTDLLNADTDEFDGFVYKAKEELSKELRRFDLAKQAKQDYVEWMLDYKRKHPSERVHRERFYYNPNLYGKNRNR